MYGIDIGIRNMITAFTHGLEPALYMYVRGSRGNGVPTNGTGILESNLTPLKTVLPPTLRSIHDDGRNNYMTMLGSLGIKVKKILREVEGQKKPKVLKH